MKRIFTLIIPIISIFLTIQVSAQTVSWNALLHAKSDRDDTLTMTLEKYGIYQNGKEVNTFYPSTQNHNKGEYVSLDLYPSKGTCTMNWFNTADGDTEYTGTYSGSTLYLKENNNQFKLLSWTKISDGEYRAKTVDSFNIYRYYIVKPWCFVDLFDLFF